MAVLLAPTTNGVDDLDSLWQYDVDDSPQPSGDAGKALQSEYEEAICHWLERTETISRRSRESEEGGRGYRHLPFQRVGTIRVRFKAAHPLQPRRYPIDPE